MSESRQPFIFILSLREDLRNPANWTDGERAAVGAHFAKLQRAARAGELLLAGRSDDHEPDGSLHAGVIGIGILSATTRAEAEAFVADDPAIVSGVMNVRVHSFNLAVHADPSVWAALT